MKYSVPQAVSAHCSPELIGYLWSAILPQYEHFDKAHQVDHALQVVSGCVELAGMYNLDFDMAVTIAMFHDTGLVDGREWHHIRSGELLQADDTMKRWFNADQLLVMQQAIEDHRASNKQEPRTMYGKVVAEADRIINAEIPCRRTVQYGLKNYPELNKEEQYERLKKHLTEKYGPQGYMHLWLELPRNVEGLQALRDLIAHPEALRRQFEIYWEEESR